MHNLCFMLWLRQALFVLGDNTMVISLFVFVNKCSCRGEFVGYAVVVMVRGLSEYLDFVQIRGTLKDFVKNDSKEVIF